MRVWIPAVMAAIAVPALIAPAHAETYTGTVTNVLDAADLVVTLNGQTQTVKLIGVAPATYGPVNWTAQGQAYARTMLLGRSVQVETDVQPRDTQGRLLAWVFLNGMLVNQELVRQGMAVAAPDSFNVRYAGNLLQAQQEAARNGAGVWNPNNHLPSPTPYPTPTWTPYPYPTPTPVPTWTPRPSYTVTPAPGFRHDHGKHLGQLKHKHKNKGRGHEHDEHEHGEHDHDGHDHDD